MNAHAKPARLRWSFHLGLATILLVGLAFSAILYTYADRTERLRIEEDFLRRAAVRHALISESLNGFQECVYTLRGLFANSDDVTHAEFTSIAQDIRSRHRGIQALQWIPIVPHARRGEFEAWARREIAPDYQITERTVDGRLVPASVRPVYRPILFTFPLAGNEIALGYDILTRPTQEDMDRSVRTRDLVLTRKIPLVQRVPDSDNFGVIMVCPVYPSGKPNVLLGFAQIVLRLEDMLSQSWIAYPGSMLDVLVLDQTAESVEERFLFGRRSPESKATQIVPRTLEDLPTGVRYEDEIRVGGRVWNCYYAPTAGWFEAQRSSTPFLFLLGGLSFTAMIAAFYRSGFRRSELVTQQVDERTAELRHTQRLLEDDIQKRQGVEAELRESRRQLDSILGQMPGIAYRCAHVGESPKAIFISRGSIEILGILPQDITSGKIAHDDFIIPEDRPLREAAIAKALAEKTSYECEYRVLSADGRTKWLFDRGQAVYSHDGTFLFIEGLAIDITGPKQAEAERDTLERKLLESQKLESLGVLAGGIAHDFNNLLTTIVGNASIARLDLPVQSPLQTNLEQIELGAQRASELCQQMLAYAGKGRFLVQRLGLEQLVRDITPLLEHSINKRARLRFHFSPDVPQVEVDATQIRQIIMNLVVNASDAIGDHDGVITLETFTLKRGDAHLAAAVLAPPSETPVFACLSVQDTGCGMDAETLGKIFDPFFTTKFAGRGLGLAAVLGIVRSHQGSLIVQSAPGAGSTFTLLLPSAPAADDQVAVPRPSSTPARPIGGTALLIDDEEGVRSVAEQMFRTVGLASLTAENGVDGLALFQQHRASVSLVLLDLTMPRMNGHETLRELRRLAPELPIILMSGYNESEVPELGTDARLGFLQKPFSLQRLHAEVSKMLA